MTSVQADSLIVAINLINKTQADILLTLTIIGVIIGIFILSTFIK